METSSLNEFSENKVSRLDGVTWNDKLQKWQAYVWNNNNLILLHCYTDEKMAHYEHVAALKRIDSSKRLLGFKVLDEPADNVKIKWNQERIEKRKYPHRFPKAPTPKRKSTPEDREWRQNILERDNYTCVICGKRNYLEAHHLESYHANPHLRLELDNGTTLCHHCHRKFHKTFGIKNNTLEQWRKFFSWYRY